MDREELVNQILARVVAKLSECEDYTRDCCNGVPDCGKPGLLVLTQDHGADCHATLENPQLLERYSTKCALLCGNQADISSFEVVVLYELTNDALCRLACGVCDSDFTRLAQQAILSGKRVFVPAEQVELLQAPAEMPAPYRAMLQEKLEFLTACGLRICPQQELTGAILSDRPSCGCCPPAAKRGEAKELALSKRVITERDVSAADADKVTCIRIGEKSILTALALDYARAKDIRIARGEER